MFYFVFFFIASFAIFIQFPSAGMQATPGIEFIGRWSFEKNQHNPLNWHPEHFFNGVILRDERMKSGYHGDFPIFPAPVSSVGSVRRPDRHDRIKANARNQNAMRYFVPFLGTGYISYQKAGREIRHHDRKGEALWRKQFPAYPIMDFRGQLLFLLSGDGNRIEIRDRNANAVGIGSIEGSFLSDYNFSGSGAGTVFCFAGGRALVIDASGLLVMDRRIETQNDTVFIKSCTISFDGKSAAFHVREGKIEKIYIYKIGSRANNSRRIMSVKLEKEYPHVLHMALGKSGLLIAAPEASYYYNLDGDLIWTRTGGNQSVRFPMYRPIYAGSDFLAIGEGTRLLLFDGRGRIFLNVKACKSGALPWRVLPGKGSSEFAIQDTRGISYFRHQKFL